MELRYNSVYIVEWLYAHDRKTGQELRDFLNLNKPEIQVVLIEVQSKADFLGALQRIAGEVERDRSLPLLQIEAHGGPDASGYYGPGPTGQQEMLSFDDSCIPFNRINRASRANLILFSAACWGHGALMAGAEGPLPFMAIVGPTDSVCPKPLFEASKEFFRGALPKNDETPAFATVVEDSARALGNSDGLAWSSMVKLTYDALIRGVWEKCDPQVMQTTALNMAATQCALDGVVDVGKFPYSTAIAGLHQQQGQATRKVWQERLMLDTWSENIQRFDFDVEGMVKIILDARYLSTP
jgi:hypothetical protein